MNSFTVTLALVASIADASYYGGSHGHGQSYGSHSQPEYSYGTKGQHVHSQYYNPHQKPVEETYVQPHVNTHRYGAHANKTQYDRRYPDAHGNYNHGGLLPKYESPHSHLAHRHTQTTDPWGTTVQAVDTDTWWSPHKQYSPPLIKYVPAALKSTVFASCKPEDGSGTALDGKIDLAQDPHRPVIFKNSGFQIDIANTFTPNGAWRFEIFETGNLSTDTTGITSGFNCYDPANFAAFVDATGDPTLGSPFLGKRFNPLEEIKNGVVNPYADPARGVIDDIPETESDTFLADGVQQEVLMNLGGGADSIIGRAMVISQINAAVIQDRGTQIADADYDDDSNADVDVVGCCIIVLVDGPAPTVPNGFTFWPQSVHTQWHAADPQHEQHTHDYPTGPSYGNSPAPQNGHGHVKYNRYPQQHSHHGW